MVRYDANGNVTGGAKIHFGPENSRAEDYYFIRVGDMRTSALGIGASRRRCEYTARCTDGAGNHQHRDVA